VRQRARGGEERGWIEAPDPDEALEAMLREEESLAVSRKKVLLRLLAAQECERLGIGVTPEQCREHELTFRRRFGLLEGRELEAWLAGVGLEKAALERFVREIVLVEALEARLDGEIRSELPLQRAARSLYSRTGKCWVQFNVELRRDAAGRAVASAARAFERLWPVVDPGARPPAVRRFFAMRKTPGLRLRFAGARAEPIRRLVGAALDDLVREGPLLGWSVVPYEPECLRFGGVMGMELAHAWFETDSLCWLRLEPLELRKGNGLGRAELSLNVLDNLFTAALSDEAEIWDVWGRLALLNGMEPVGGDARDFSGLRLDGLRLRASLPEREILDDYERAGRSLALSLEEAGRTGRMLVGPRGFLAAIALFHWNRFGLTIDARARILALMLGALDPHRHRP